MPAPLRIHPQQAFEGFHAFDQAFRVVQPVDTDDQGAVAQALLQAAGLSRFKGFLGEIGHGIGIDADREGACGEPSTEYLEGDKLTVGGRLATASACLRDDIIAEGVQIGTALKADQVEVAESADDLFMVRQGDQDLRCRPRDVEKEAHPLPAADAAQPFRSEEHTSELQSLMRSTYDVICLKKKNSTNKKH